MAVLGPYVGVNMNGHSGIHNQLTKSLERILEDAYLSGELKLSGRKLKEFPKPVKFDLTDTVVADLSKNRFAELPDEVTSYLYLERLLLAQNAITAVPETVGGLQSLTFLDLSSNQLTELPREICQMPLQVLLLSNNLMTCLPKEIGRMSSLAELDASDNRLTQVPMTLGDCANMRALNLSNNQLGLLPLQITYLRLEYLDVSCNCISSLPLELRNMTSLVTLNLENNPLVSPPTTVCMRGRIHIFKYLENMANKESMPAHRREDPRRSTKHNSYVSTTPQSNMPIVSGNATIDCLRHRPRPVVDSGYCTDGLDKRWCNDGEGTGGSSGRSTPSTPSTLSPGTALSRAHSCSSESPLGPLIAGLRISPDGNISNGDDKSKLSHQQTYRQYKEALRQQRHQDVYRSRPDQNSPDLDSPNNSPVHLHRSQSSPQSPVANGTLYNRNVSPNSSPNVPNSPLLHSTPRRFQNGNANEKVDDLPNKRPVQKVVPSRNVNNKTYTNCNGNEYQNSRVNGSPLHTDSYIKPTSPTKSPTGTLTHNSLGRVRNVNGGENGAKLVNSSVAYLKGSGSKPGAKISWGKEPSPDKLSFTMKREFDKQKEELDLLQQLRTTIECRLKMSLPSDLAPVLCDGVVLCHLANHVRPRAVASVHVPSATQPKLTMARCRRNVDNFIEACRRIGVDEEDICSAEDILCHHQEFEGPRTGFEAVALTLAALLEHATPIYDISSHPQNNIDPNLNTDFYQNPYKRNYTEDRVLPNFNFNSNQQDFIAEEEEYDVNYQNNNMNISENANYSPDLYVNNDCLRNRNLSYQNNKVQFVTPFFKQDGVFQSENLDIYDTDVVDGLQEVDERRTEEMERYDRSKLNLIIENNLNKQVRIVKTSGTFEPPVEPPVVTEEERFKITVLCLGSFFLSVLVLFFYPL